MPRLSLGLGASNSSKPIGGGAAPTTLPLSTPNLYFSGLTFNIPWVDSGYTYYIDTYYFSEAYVRNSNTQWRGGYFGYVQDQFSYDGSIWNLRVKCQVDDGYDSFDSTISVATNSASGTAIPLTGWQNQGIVLSGTLIIRTTP